MTRDEKTLRETYAHMKMLVNELRSRPDVILYFRETGRKVPSDAPGDFLRALMPQNMLSDGDLLILARECRNAMVFLAARSLLTMGAPRTQEHNPVHDVVREVHVIREKVYA